MKMYFSVIIYFSSLYLETLQNYTTTNMFDGLELQNVCENSKRYARAGKHRKAMSSIS